MKGRKKKNTQPLVTYFLKPGYIYYTHVPTLISTVLGSCIAVSIFDRTTRTGAMNHFVHPQLSDNDSPTPMFAKPSMVQLIRILKAHKLNFNQLEAQIFGGAVRSDVNPRQEQVGQMNLKIAEDLLENHSIKLVNRDVGGRFGRKIVFNTKTGETVTARVESIRNSDWYQAH